MTTMVKKLKLWMMTAIVCGVTVLTGAADHFGRLGHRRQGAG